MLSVEKSTALGYKSQTLWTKQAAAFRGVEGIGQIRKVLWFFLKYPLVIFRTVLIILRSSQDLIYCSRYEQLYFCAF